MDLSFLLWVPFPASRLYKAADYSHGELMLGLQMRSIQGVVQTCKIQLDGILGPVIMDINRSARPYLHFDCWW